MYNHIERDDNDRKKSDFDRINKIIQKLYSHNRSLSDAVEENDDTQLGLSDFDYTIPEKLMSGGLNLFPPEDHPYRKNLSKSIARVNHINSKISNTKNNTK